MLLNAVLGAVLVFAGVQWRNTYMAAKEREHKMLSGGPKKVPAAQFTPLPVQPPVLATGYNNVAQKLLLHPSRNPDIPPPPPVEVLPPPPPPMPALPKYHGTMNLDGQQVAILSIGTDSFQEVAAGATIGPFKLVDINTRDITYEWMGQQVRKTLQESINRSEPAPAPANNAPAPANAPPPPPAVKSQIGPVGDTSAFGTRSCDPNDSYPEGAEVDGFRKQFIQTPFAKVCRWEQIRK